MVDGPSLEAARQLAGVAVGDLFLRYFTLGGTNSRRELNGLLCGDLTFGAAQYDVLAHALNERFVELDLDHPVPYSND